LILNQIVKVVSRNEGNWGELWKIKMF
jgi:hypothetical protein